MPVRIRRATPAHGDVLGGRRCRAADDRLQRAAGLPVPAGPRRRGPDADALHRRGPRARTCEYGTNVMVNPPGSHGLGPAGASAMPRRSSITCRWTRRSPWRPGRTIWGYPKVMADFTVRGASKSAGVRDGQRFGFDVTIDGQFAVSMEFQHGAAGAVGASPSQTAGSSDLLASGRCHPRNRRADDAFGRALPAGRRVGCGSASIRYGRELAALGLPKRALISSSAENVADDVRRRQGDPMTRVLTDDQARCRPRRRPVLRGRQTAASAYRWMRGPRTGVPRPQRTRPPRPVTPRCSTPSATPSCSPAPAASGPTSPACRT